MKKKTLDNKCKPAHEHALRGRTAALLIGLAFAASVMQGTSLFAAVYDDFENPALLDTLWTRTVSYGTGTQTVANGHVTLDVTPFQPGGAFCFLTSRRTWTLQEGRTLEFRADLLNSNDDGALAYFGFNVAGEGGYLLALDEDTIAVWKRPNPLQCFFLTNGAPVKVSNVKLVVSMTGVQSGVLLQFRILDNDNAGAVLFEREYLDTAAADPMQVGTDNPPGNYLGRSGYFQLALFRCASDHIVRGI